MTRFQRIEKVIKDSIDNLEHLEVHDESHQHSVPEGSESHFRLLMVSDFFSGQSRVARQRQIYSLLQPELDGGLHALTLRLLTAEEWEKQTSEFKSPECASKSR